MTGNQYQTMIDKLGLSQLAAARLLRVDGRTSRKWANNERPVPDWVPTFLDYLWATRHTPAFQRLMKTSGVN